MRTPARALGWLMLFVVGALQSATAASLAKKLETVFAPTRVEQASLARDGQSLAFAVHDGRERQLIIYNLRPRGRIAKARLETTTAGGITQLVWVATDRLVAVAGDSAVLVIDAAGEILLQLDEARSLAPRAQTRRGRPAVRVLGPSATPDCLMLEVKWHEDDRDARLDVLSMHTRTVELSLVHTRELRATDGNFMTDRQGRPRVLLAPNGAGAGRQFLHLPVEAERVDWLPFDRVVRDGNNAAWRMTPQNLLGERAFPVGFDSDPHVLYFASNVGRDTYGIYALNLRTGHRTGFAIEDAARDLADPLASGWTRAGLIFDRSQQTLAGVATSAGSRWLDREVAELQRTLERIFSDRSVQVLEWDDVRGRFLFRVDTATDAGRYFVYEKATRRCIEYQRNPALLADEANRLEPFTCTTRDGVQLVGTLTWPRTSPASAALPALVVWLNGGPLTHVPARPQPEPQALAAAGLAVLQLNTRGSLGFGRRHREQIRSGFDRVPLEDLTDAVGALVAQGKIDRARVTIAGEGFGGYLALRGRQLFPNIFCGAAAIHAPLDLAQLLPVQASRDRPEANLVAREGSRAQTARVQPSDSDGSSSETIDPPPADPWEFAKDVEDREPLSFEQEFDRWFFGPATRQDTKIMARIDELKGPILLLHDSRYARIEVGPVRRLRETLARRKQVVEFVELPPAFGQGTVAARATIFREIAEFLAACQANAGDLPAK